MPVNVRCGWCGSGRVSRDAWADWDVERQTWVLGAVFDDGFCHRCGRATTLVEAPVGGTVSVATY